MHPFGIIYWKKKTELYISNGMIAFLQSHVHVGFVASGLGIAAVVELLRYCLLQRLKDRLVAIDEEGRREYLDGRARETSEWEATSSSGQLQSRSQSRSRSRRRRNWNDWTRSENSNGNGMEEHDDGMETPLLSESQPENWAMEDNTSVQSQSASASATNQSAVSWWEEPDANTNTNTDTDMNTSSTSKKSWFSRAFDKTSASDAGGGSGSGSGSAAPGDTSSVDFAPIDGDLDMEMGHQSWAVEDSSATVGADEAGGFGFGSSSGGGGGGGGSRDEPDLSWAVEKDD